MPITGLYFIPEINHTAASTTVSTLLDRLAKSHHPSYHSKWAFEHRLYREAPLPPPTSPSVSHHSPPLPPQQQPSSTLKALQILELSHHPKLFTLAGATMITIDREFQALVQTKMLALWTTRQTLKGNGECYEVDDLKIRIATVFQAQDAKGVIIEVEYLPAVYLYEGEPIIRDFVEQLRIPQAREFFRPKDQDAAAAAEDKVFTAMDTGRQYMELLRIR